MWLITDKSTFTVHTPMITNNYMKKIVRRKSRSTKGSWHVVTHHPHIVIAQQQGKDVL